jgi:hypothetical protein
MAYTNIDDPSAHFQTALWTGGNDASRTITNDGNSDLQPDLIWAKARTSTSYTDNHFIVDSSRGRLKGLVPNDTSAETTTTGNESQQAERDLVSFNSDGFTVGQVNSTAALNASSASLVGWQWKANGGTTSSNTDGNTTTTVQANQDAGFSIVTYTGTGSGSQTMGHGLGVTPNIVLTKNRSGTGRAWSFNGNFGGLIYGTNKLILNQTSALTADTNDVTAASSTTFTGGGSNGVNANGVTYVAYCFAEKQGYSKFGSYVGNGNATSSPFIYTGFKPAFVMMKNSSVGSSWHMVDNKRLDYNPTTKVLYANLSNAEGTEDRVDLLSNGFKLRTTNTEVNGNGYNIIYMAFASSPFTTSSGIPTTAR